MGIMLSVVGLFVAAVISKETRGRREHSISLYSIGLLWNFGVFLGHQQLLLIIAIHKTVI